MEEGIVKTLRYFSQFEYAPTLNELHMFHPKLISRTSLLRVLAGLQKKEKILWTTKANKETRYTLGGYSIFLNKTDKKEAISRQKRNRLKYYLGILRFLRNVELVGLSGSVAMNNATRDADIDLFIIARGGKMWRVRAQALFAAALLGIRRRRSASHVHARNKVCLNMFMDEHDLQVPFKKQTSYVAHEILQMRPLFDRSGIYSRFLSENAWIFKIYPNAQHLLGDILDKHVSKSHQRKQSNSIAFTDAFLRYIQLASINKNRTTEIITDTQLWFFPDDFEKKVTV